MADIRGVLPHAGATDVTLFTAIADGDADALAEAYDRHGSGIYSFALRLSGPEPAERVTRDVFLSLWRSPEEFALSDGSLRMPLLLRAHAGVVDAVDEDPAYVGPAGGAGGVAAHTLSQLLPGQQVAIALTYFGGLTYEQVATLVQRPKGLVAQDIRTGLSRLAAA